MGQSLILHFVFLSAGCSYSVCSFTSLSSFFFFFSSCFPVSLFPDLIRLLLFRCPPSCLSFSQSLLLSLGFLLRLLYLQLQRFLCRKRLPHNHKLPIFQKQITQFCIRRNHTKITNYVFLPQVVKHFFLHPKAMIFLITD